MIALLLADRCTRCDLCVAVCPADVFDPVPDAPPAIARPEDCTTCFQCELYCRADALYVGPRIAPEALPVPDEATVRTSGWLGRYRRDAGWDEWADVNPNLQWRMGEVFARAAAELEPGPR